MNILITFNLVISKWEYYTSNNTTIREEIMNMLFANYRKFTYN